MDLSVGSGWWSVIGQCADIVGFALLTWDVYPEYRASRVRRLSRSYLTQTRRAIEDLVLNKERLVPDVLWAILQKEKIDLRTAIKTGQLMSMPSRHVTNAMTAEQRQLTNELIGNLSALEQVHEESHSSVDGSWFPNPHSGNTRAVDELIPLPDSLRKLARTIGRLANKPLIIDDPDTGLPVEAPPKLLQQLIAVNNVVRMFDIASGARHRWLVWVAVGLILGGFLGQVIGSIPVEAKGCEPRCVVMTPRDSP
ncbi:MAG TPA: hypothetical protein VIN06_00735 [Devosia sp.]